MELLVRSKLGALVSTVACMEWKLLRRGVSSPSSGSYPKAGGQRLQKEKGRGCRGTADDGTYCVERALPVVGDVGLAFRRFLEDPFVTFIRGHLSHQPACRRARRVQTNSDHGLSTSFMINSCNACPKSSVQTTAKRDQKRPRHTQNTQRATD